jgi:hypothetical protein
VAIFQSEGGAGGGVQVSGPSCQVPRTAYAIAIAISRDLGLGGWGRGRSSALGKSAACSSRFRDAASSAARPAGPGADVALRCVRRRASPHPSLSVPRPDNGAASAHLYAANWGPGSERVRAAAGAATPTDNYVAAPALSPSTMAVAVADRAPPIFEGRRGSRPAYVNVANGWGGTLAAAAPLRLPPPTPPFTAAFYRRLLTTAFYHRCPSSRPFPPRQLAYDPRSDKI